MQQFVDVLVPNGSESRGSDSLRAEKLDCADSSHFAPVVAVGSEGHVCEVVGEPSRSFTDWSAAAFEIVGFEYEFGVFGRGDDYGGHSAELEVHDGSVDFG